MKAVTRYKFLREGIKSDHGNHVWEVDKWYTEKRPIDICNVGFHCSKEPYQAFSYVQGELLALVECKGKHIDQEDKECWESQRVIRVWKWEKKNSVRLAVFSAELCLKNFEDVFPNDKRPREAIEAAKAWIKHPTAKNEEAARSAARSAALSAESAAEAARSAARSAGWAGSAARSAARSAALSARSAVESVGWAGSAAWADTINKIIRFFNKEVTKLKEYKP